MQIALGIGLFGTQAVFISLIDLPAPTIVAAQGALVVLVLVGIHLLWRPRMSLRLPRDRALVLLLGTCYAGDHLLFTAGVQRTTVANLITLVYLYPVLTAALSVWILGERVERHTVVALALGLGGTAIILYPSLVEFRVTDMQASAMGLGVALLVAIQRIFIKRLHPSLPTLTVNTYKYGVIALIFLPGLGGLPGALDARTAVLLLCTALLAGVVAAFLVLAGVRKVEANKGAVLSYVEPLVALGLAWLVLAQQPSPYAVVGGMCIFASGYLVIRRRRPSPSRP